MAEEMTQSNPLNPVLCGLRLRHFKSVNDQEISLAPLTVLVGENSSGKSSILQALLLMKQAVAAQSPGANFPLNGTFVRLGTLGDVRTAQAADDASVEMGVDISFPEQFKAPWTRRPGGGALKLSIALGDTAPDESTSTRIRGLTLDLESVDGNKQLSLTIRSSEGDSSIVSVPTRSPWIGAADCDLSLQGELTSPESDHPINFVGTALAGAIPSGLLVEQDAAHALAINWTDGFVGKCALQLLESHSRNRRMRLVKSPPRDDLDPKHTVASVDQLVAFAIRSINDLLEEHDSVSEVLSNSLWQQIDIPEMTEELVSRLVSEEGSLLADTIAQGLNTPGKVQLLCNEVEWEELEYYTRFLQYFIDENIWYLGPLREAPQIIMPNTPTALTGDLGLRGEFTAAVLQSLGDKPVHTPLPDGNHDDVPLIEAVTRWAIHLELVETVEVADLAALGLTINVRPSGLDRTVPLPSVGVGVSQLLPVLVLCLLADPGSLILLEQPELHLHPGLQQRLADFLIAMTRSGRQLIVETHSEYMVSRIRRRVAADPEDKLRSRIKIVFAERDRASGFTAYRDIDLSPYGDINNWPTGFFDQAAEEEREIIKAGLHKRTLQDD